MTGDHGQWWWALYTAIKIARPQSQFPHSCVCERFIYSQDRSTYFLQQNRQTDHGNGNKSLSDTWMWKLGLRPHNSFSVNICFEFSVLCLCSLMPRPQEKYRLNTHFNVTLSRGDSSAWSDKYRTCCHELYPASALSCRGNGSVGSAPACYGSSLGSNLDISLKNKMGYISKRVANTLLPAKKNWMKKNIFGKAITRQ